MCRFYTFVFLFPLLCSLFFSPIYFFSRSNFHFFCCFPALPLKSIENICMVAAGCQRMFDLLLSPSCFHYFMLCCALICRVSFFIFVYYLWRPWSPNALSLFRVSRFNAAFPFRVPACRFHFPFGSLSVYSLISLHSLFHPNCCHFFLPLPLDLHFILCVRAVEFNSVVQE